MSTLAPPGEMSCVNGDCSNFSVRMQLCLMPVLPDIWLYFRWAQICFILPLGGGAREVFYNNFLYLRKVMVASAHGLLRLQTGCTYGIYFLVQISY